MYRRKSTSHQRLNLFVRKKHNNTAAAVLRYFHGYPTRVVYTSNRVWPRRKPEVVRVGRGWGKNEKGPNTTYNICQEIKLGSRPILISASTAAYTLRARPSKMQNVSFEGNRTTPCRRTPYLYYNNTRFVCTWTFSISVSTAPANCTLCTPKCNYRN